MKAKDRQLRRSTKQKLSYTAWKNVLRWVLPRGLKHSAFLPTATVLCVSEKNSLPVLVAEHAHVYNLQNYNTLNKKS